MDISLVTLLFSFQGRINRAKYWITAIVFASLLIVVFALAFFFNFNIVFYVLTSVIFIAMLVSGLAVGIKRLHDRNKSAWWLLLFYVVPPILDGVGRSVGLTLVFEVASAAISIWALVELGFLRGTSGPNQYGPDPLAAQ